MWCHCHRAGRGQPAPHNRFWLRPFSTSHSIHYSMELEKPCVARYFRHVKSFTHALANGELFSDRSSSPCACVWSLQHYSSCSSWVDCVSHSLDWKMWGCQYCCTMVTALSLPITCFEGWSALLQFAWELKPAILCSNEALPGHTTCLLLELQHSQQ